jgi:TonB-linked outer membrane protein, SusC/RagA family/TonB-dependent outer membrane receptor, SusC/RagA subfamily, signature region
MQRIIATIIILLLHLSLYAQDNKNLLSGHVYDSNNEPLAGAFVIVKGNKLGASTNENGYFTFNKEINIGSIIEFSYIGMESKTVKYKGEKFLKIFLKENALGIDGVVVKANSNINEIDLRAKSGIVQSIDIKRVENKPMIDMGLALQGAIPGLNISNTGELGATPKIRIRGNSSLRKGNITNEPLYIMDGQVITPDSFYNLNPSDIKSIKVLKDAAACALYGIKAANGVIEITSQRGTNGKIYVTYSSNLGITTRGRRGIEMMNSSEKLELERLLQNPETPGYRYSADYFNKYYSNSPMLSELISNGNKTLDSLRNINTDWFNILIRNSFYQKHNISIKGGSESTTYYASANYTKQGGRLPGNDKQRMSMRLNLDQRLGNVGYLLMSVNGGYTKTDTPNGTTSDPTALVYNLNPYEQKTGELISYPGMTYRDVMNQYYAVSSGKDFGISGSLTLNPLSGLNISAVCGLNFLLDESSQFTPASSYSETHNGIPEIERGIYSKAKNTTSNFSSNVRATYNKVLNEKHDFTIGGNVDYYLYNSDNVLMRGYGVGNVNSAAAINQSLQGNRKPYVNGIRDKNAQLGIGTVLGYSYNSTYDLYATYKADASSILPADKRWNSAWAVGVAWTPTKYNFLVNNGILTNLNFRGSYGYTANLNGVSTSSTIASFSYSTSSYENQRPLDLISLYNKDLKPEQTISIDAGVSMEFIKRFTINLNWYNRITKQALLDVPIPSSSGYTSLKRNIGILKNTGIEGSINARVIDRDNLTLVLGANLAYNSNKVIDLYYADKIFTSEDALIPDYEVGKSYDMLYGPQSLGINSLTGYPIFLLPNGKEKQATETLLKDDVVALGHITPPFSGSFNISLTYKSFDLDADFYYVLGGVQRFNYSYVRTKDNINKNAVSGQSKDMWFKIGDENKIYPTPFYTSSIAETNIVLYPNTLTIGKSDYLKLSMVSLRYRVPEKFLSQNLPIVKYASLAFQGSNLYTLTSYRESDPESGTLAGTLQPVFSLNINLTF